MVNKMAKEKKLTRVTMFATELGVLDRVEVQYQVRDEADADFAEWRQAPDKNYHLDGSQDGVAIPNAVKALMQTRAQA